MAKTFDRAYPQSFVPGCTAVTTAAATFADDAPTNTVALGPAAGAEGEEVASVVVVPRATTTLTVALLWVSADAGTTRRLVRAKTIAAQTISATAGPVETDFGYTAEKPLRLGNGERLYVGTSVALTAGWAWRAEKAAY